MKETTDTHTIDTRFPQLHIALPAWIEHVVPAADYVYRSDEEKMRLVLALATENTRRGGGGPFGAAVFDAEHNLLIAPGVNMVIPSRWSSAHAEVVAFAIAQQRMETHDLGGPGMPPCELFTSTEPCAMCLGATIWTGVRRLVCSARDEDAREIGFDEGPKPNRWPRELKERGIEVKRDLLREEGRRVLRTYKDGGGAIYNARQGTHDPEEENRRNSPAKGTEVVRDTRGNRGTKDRRSTFSLHGAENGLIIAQRND